MQSLAKALRYKPQGRGFDSRWGKRILSIYLILPHYDPGVDSASKGNEYLKILL
jgi:hypothetical protein